MPADYPLVGPQGPQGIPGPALGAGTGRKYAAVSAALSGYSAPDNAALELTTGADLRALVVATNPATGAVQVLVGKWTTATNQRSYALSIDAAGYLQFQYSTDGTSTGAHVITSSITIASALGGYAGPVWLRGVGLSNVAGAASCTFYYSLDGGTTWLRLGAVVTNATPGPFFSGSSLATAGVQGGGSLLPLGGRLYMAEIWNTTGTLISRLDVRALATAGSTYTDSVGTAGSVWTPGASVALFTDEINTLDFRDQTLLVSRLSARREFNLADHGAALDGATDDSAVISAALASGQAIIHPGGVCMVQPDVLLLAKGISLRGVGFEYAEGAGVFQTVGSVFRAISAGTNLCRISDTDAKIDGIGFEGAALCTGDVLQIDGSNALVDEVCCTNPSGTGTAFHTTLNGNQILVGRLMFSGNRLAGAVGIKMEGPDGEYAEIHGAFCPAGNILIYAGGTQIGLVHGASAATGTHHLIICATKVFIGSAQLDNGTDSMVYIDPTAKAGGQTLDTIVIDQLHCNIGGSTPPAANTVSAIKVNTAAGFDVKNVRIRGTAKAPSTNPFLYAIDAGADPTKLKGWDVDLGFLNPSSIDATGNPLITPSTYRPELLRASVSIDSGGSTWKPSTNAGSSTQTPGAVTTVTIAHGLYKAPRSFEVVPGDANSRGAGAYSLTADATSITITFSGALTPATAYTWNWRAEV